MEAESALRGPTDDTRLDRVAAEQVHALYAKAAVPLLTVLVNSSIVAYVVSGAAASEAIATWLGALYGITLVRLALRQRYLRQKPGDYRTWETYFAVGAGFNGVVWGSAALLLYPPASVPLQVFLAFVLAGMTAGATASTSTSFRAFAAFTVPALSPIAIRFLSEGDRIHVAMAAMTMLFGLAMSAIARASGASYRESATFRFQNASLVENLEGARARLTELNEALEKRVLERTSELNAVLDHAPVMLALYDSNGRVERVNREFEQRFGYTLEDFRKGDLSIDRCADPSSRAGLREHLLGEDPHWRDFRVITKDNRSLVTSWANARLASGMIIGIGQDVTQRRQSQEALALSERMASLGTLAAGVAHEINNPLAFVLGNLEFVASSLQGAADSIPTKSPEAVALLLREAVEAMKEAHGGARRVASIVSDLRMFSRGSDDRSEVVPLLPVLETSARLVANDLRHRATLVCEFGDVPPVRATEGRLGHVFVSLLINAIQSIPEGEPSRNEVRLTSKTADDGSAVVEVRDTGSGIPEDQLQRIFDPFFTTKPIGQGTGLGLSVCKGMVGALGGRLEVESRLREGSTFRVVLPKAPVQPGRSTPPPVATPKVGRARILIVDDEPMFVKALLRMLRSHDVAEEGMASRAVARVAAGEVFDVILCDLMMPVVTGMDFYGQVLRVAPHLASRIVFMTGGAFTEKSAEFLEANTNHRLSKPFGKGELDAVLASVLGGQDDSLA